MVTAQCLGDRMIEFSITMPLMYNTHSIKMLPAVTPVRESVAMEFFLPVPVIKIFVVNERYCQQAKLERADEIN